MKIRGVLAVLVATLALVGDAPAGEILEESCPAKLLLARDEIPALREKVRTGPPKLWWEQLRQWADGLDVAKWNPQHGTAPLDFESHMNFDIPSMGVSFLISGDPKYAATCKAMMHKMIDWVPEGDQGFEWRYWKAGGVGLQAAPFCMGYDCIYSTLTEDERRMLRNVLVRRAAYPLYGFLSQEIKGLDPKTIENQGYNAICGLLFCALTLRGHHPDAEAWREMALRLVGYGLQSVEYDGSINDEIGYMFSWMGNLPLMLDAVARSDGTDLWRRGGFHKSFDFLLAQTLPSEVFDPQAAYDARRQGKQVPLSFWHWAEPASCNFYPSALLAFASKFQNPGYLWLWRRLNIDGQGQPIGTGGIFSILRWDSHIAAGQPPHIPPAAVFPRHSHVYLRTGQTSGDVLLTAGQDTLDIYGYGENWLISSGGRQDGCSIHNNRFAWSHNTVFIGDNTSTYIRPIRAFWDGPSAAWFRLGVARKDEFVFIGYVDHFYSDVKRNDREVLLMRPSGHLPAYVLVTDTIEKQKHPAFMTQQFGVQKSLIGPQAQFTKAPESAAFELFADQRRAVLHRRHFNLEFHSLLPETATMDLEDEYRLYYWGRDRQVLGITAGSLVPAKADARCTATLERADPAGRVRGEPTKAPDGGHALRFAGVTGDDRVELAGPTCRIEGQKTYRVNFPYRWTSEQPAHNAVLTVQVGQYDKDGNALTSHGGWDHADRSRWNASMDGWRLTHPYFTQGGFRVPIQPNPRFVEQRLPDLGAGWYRFEVEIIARDPAVALKVQVVKLPHPAAFIGNRPKEAHPTGDLEVGPVTVVERPSRPRSMQARFATLLVPVLKDRPAPEVRRHTTAEALAVEVSAGPDRDWLLGSPDGRQLHAGQVHLTGKLGFVRYAGQDLRCWGGHELVSLADESGSLLHSEAPVDVEIAGRSGAVRCSRPTAVTIGRSAPVPLSAPGYYRLSLTGEGWKATPAKEPWK